MANKRIKELVEKSSFAAGDYFPIDNENGTKKVDGAKIVTPLGNISGNSDEYSSTKAYKVGDLVIHDNVLYKCKTACSAGSWNANQSCFEAKTLASVVTQLNSDLNNYITYRDVTIGNITIGAQGFVDILSYRPTVSGKNLLFVLMCYYGNSSTGDGAVIVDCYGKYLSGRANSTITDLTLRYFFK